MPIRMKVYHQGKETLVAAADADKDWYEHLFILGDDHFSAAGHRIMFREIARGLL